MKKQLLNFKHKVSYMQPFAFDFMSLAKGSYLVLFLLLFSVSGIYAQNCKVSITAENNIESVNSEGRIYFMELQNSGNQDLSLALSVVNNNSCVNPDQTQGNSNVNLNAQILTEEKQLIVGNILLKSNDVYKFLVKVTVPKGTSINHWNCSEVKAISDACPDMSVSLILNTYIPNPEEQ
jgi:hypothetical protein